MNTLFALVLACTLSTAPNADDKKTTSSESTTYIVTDKLAIWLTETGKLKLTMAQQASNATIEVRNQKGTLYQNTVNLRKGIQQTFDLSEMGDGTYQIQVTVGQEVITKTLRIEHSAERTLRLS